MTALGIVVIGRNEGERLVRCLLSIRHWSHIVYVDSGSKDGSIQFALNLGIVVVNLDLTTPFTAARARNAGFSRLMEMHSDIEYVQFVDGDCTILSEWFDKGISSLQRDRSIASVCGRVFEIERDRNLYSRLADLEWDGPTGEIDSCGGIFLIRAKVFRDLNGFRDSLIAGEEPELCLRIRKCGHKVMRIPYPMATHDIAMSHFSQWFSRARRGGYAYAENCALHGSPPDFHKVHEVKSALFWGAVLPLNALASLILSLWLNWAWIGFAIASLGFAYLGLKVYRNQLQAGRSISDARLYALFCVLGKLPCFLGILQYWFNRLSGRASKLIEYKVVNS